jgi:hypothetical protein
MCFQFSHSLTAVLARVRPARGATPGGPLLRFVEDKMATWRVAIEGGDVVLTYLDAAGSRECGRGGVEVLPDLVGWVSEQAAPWDQVRTERGIFVRQVAPEVRVCPQN